MPDQAEGRDSATWKTKNHYSKVTFKILSTKCVKFRKYDDERANFYIK